MARVQGTQNFGPVAALSVALALIIVFARKSKGKDEPPVENVEVQGKPHPLEHIDPLKCYDWMLSECGALNANRQARQDGLISTITSVSSASLLAVPALFFTSGTTIPDFRSAPLLYTGLLLFVASLAASMAEQHYSVLAHAKQIELNQAYYTMRSTITEDPPSRKKVQQARRFAYGFFAMALFTSSVALFLV